MREVSRLGPPAATRLTEALDPLVQRARHFLEEEMDAGTMRRQDARLVLLSAYSAVIGVATEVEVLRGVSGWTRPCVHSRSVVESCSRSCAQPSWCTPPGP